MDGQTSRRSDRRATRAYLTVFYFASIEQYRVAVNRETVISQSVCHDHKYDTSAPTFFQNESNFGNFLRQTSAHGLPRIVKRHDQSRFVWIVVCLGIYGVTVLIFGLMATNYKDPNNLIIQLELEEVWLDG